MRNIMVCHMYLVCYILIILYVLNLDMYLFAVPVNNFFLVSYVNHYRYICALQMLIPIFYS